MPTANLIRENIGVNDGLESIVIVNCLGDIPGGRTLDVSNVAEGTTVLKAGHIIISADATGVCKPMPVSGTSYDSLPASHSYVGVLKASITVADPRAAIMTMGQVNQSACPYSIPDGAKSALTHIEWLY